MWMLGFTRRSGILLLAAAFAALLVAACAHESPKEHVASDSEANAPPGKLGAVSSVEDLLAAGLVGSAHDFRQAGGQALDLCSACHTPHIALGRAPLLDKRPQTMTAIRPYQARGVELDDSTLLCLSCHDGVMAPDVFSFAHAMKSATPLGTSWIGSGSLTSHPIGVKYPLANPTYNPEAAVTADGRIKLPNGRVQCISCHDAHNTHRIRGMLVNSNDGSRLCLSCHHL
jgi:predicted CXXCH cytochrome family protein